MLSIIMLVITAIALIGVLVGALVGAFKGWKHCLVGLCRTVAAALLAFLTVFIFSSCVPAGSLLGGVIDAIANEINPGFHSDAANQIVGSVVYMVVMPFIFSMLLVVFDLILLIPAHFIGRAVGAYKKKGADPVAEPEQTSAEALKKAKRNKIFSKLGGVGINAVTAIIMIMLLLLPVSGLVYTFTDGISQITDTAESNDVHIPTAKPNVTIDSYTITDGEGMLIPENLHKLIDQYVGPIRDNIVMSLSHTAPMKLIYNSLGGSPNGNEITLLFDFIDNALYLTVDLEDYGDDQKIAVENVIGYVSKYDSHSQIVADILTTFAKEELKADHANNGGKSEIVTRPLLEFFANESDRPFGKENVKTTLETIKNVLEIMIDYDLPYALAVSIEEDNFNTLFHSFANEKFMENFMLEIYHNDDLREEMITPWIDFVFNVLVSQFEEGAARIHIASKTDFNDEQIRSEAKLFAKIIDEMLVVINDISEISEDETPTDAIAKIDMATLGRCIDDLEKSIFVGEEVDLLIVTILKTSSFDQLRGIADILVKHIEVGDDLDMESLLSSVKEFVALLAVYENGESSDFAALAETLKSLNASLKGTTKDVMLEIINDSSVLQMGMTGGSSSGDAPVVENTTSQKLLNTVINQIADAELTNEEYEQEAKALDYTLQLVGAVTNSSSSTSEAVKEIYGDEAQMKEMIQTMTSSTITSSAIEVLAYETNEEGERITDEEGNFVMTDMAAELAENIDDEDREKLLGEIESVYKEELSSADDETKQTLQNNLETFATIFGMDLSQKFDQWDADLIG